MRDRTSLIALIVAMILAGAGIFAIVRQAAPIVEIAPAPPPPVSAPTPATAAPSASPAPSGPAIYRCKVKGAVVYSDEPCGEGAKVVDVQPTRGFESPRQSPSSATKVSSAKPVAPAVQASSGEAVHASECKRLEDAMAWIDSEARQGGTIERMDELKERRRKLLDRKYELRC